MHPGSIQLECPITIEVIPIPFNKSIRVSLCFSILFPILFQPINLLLLQMFLHNLHQFPCSRLKGILLLNHRPLLVDFCFHFFIVVLNFLHALVEFFFIAIVQHCFRKDFPELIAAVRYYRETAGQGVEMRLFTNW